MICLTLLQSALYISHCSGHQNACYAECKISMLCVYTNMNYQSLTEKELCKGKFYSIIYQILCLKDWFTVEFNVKKVQDSMLNVI